MSQEKTRKALYGSLYGTPDCHGAGLTRSTSRGRGGSILQGVTGPVYSKRLERRDVAMTKQKRETVIGGFVAMAGAPIRYMRAGFRRRMRELQERRRLRADVQTGLVAS